MYAQIMDIKRFAVHDGDGIRTTVFFKGCPLRCVWCHNPEGLMYPSQIAYTWHKCIHCGSCDKICSANHFQDGVHTFIREACSTCGKCENVCPSRCFRIYGKKYSVDELMSIIIEDNDFYDTSSGGVTLSGGECLLQTDVCQALLKRCKDAGVNTAVDTCGYVSREKLDMVIPYTDTFLYDIKAYDEQTHIQCTGVSNRIILDNLQYLSETGKHIEIRVPYIPGYNSDQMEKIGRFLHTINNISDVKLLPFHNLSETKYEALGMKSRMPTCSVPNTDEIKRAEQLLRDAMKC